MPGINHTVLSHWQHWKSSKTGAPTCWPEDVEYTPNLILNPTLHTLLAGGKPLTLPNVQIRKLPIPHLANVTGSCLGLWSTASMPAGTVIGCYAGVLVRKDHLPPGNNYAMSFATLRGMEYSIDAKVSIAR